MLNGALPIKNEISFEVFYVDSIRKALGYWQGWTLMLARVDVEAS